MTTATATYLGFDCETTGISPHAPEGAGLLEIGLVAYTADLTEIDQHTSLVCSPAAADHRGRGLSPFVAEMHDTNGLFAELDDADPSGLGLGEVEAGALDFVGRHFGDVKPLLLGSSITLDRTFLAAEMPALLAAIHYRSVDATSLAQAACHTAGVDVADLYNHSRAAVAFMVGNPGVSLVDAAARTAPSDGADIDDNGAAHRVLHDIRHSAGLVAVTLHHLRN